METELYKKYRPSNLDGVVGNAPTVKALRKMIETGTVPASILFHGPSGCGKTTLARILRDALGCTQRDYFEMNSSNIRGIDSIRELVPTLSLRANGKCKIYLLDEVHGLTKDAQNALLKMLEDTPPRTHFFLCTTDPGKLIAAIRTRCTALEVKLLKDVEMKSLVDFVCKSESIVLSSAVYDALLSNAAGGARRALVLLDRIRHLDEADQLETLAADTVDGPQEVRELCQALLNKKGWQVVAKLLKEIKEEPETVRLIILGYMNAVLLNSGKARAKEIMDSFATPFYDNGGKAMLTGSCFEVCT